MLRRATRVVGCGMRRAAPPAQTHAHASIRRGCNPADALHAPPFNRNRAVAP
ncbi:hypothetical protein P355_0732 [Burkholderia cenocepacia KC-01]|nr:hypothetical protein P355_0732 [Burkholderia cenocepacia KC-01]